MLAEYSVAMIHWYIHKRNYYSMIINHWGNYYAIRDHLG